MVSPDEDPEEIGQRLAAYLRAVTGVPSLELEGSPRLLTGGYVNRIVAFSLRSDGCPDHLRGGLILRLAPPWAPDGKREHEQAVHAEVFRLGYPTPEPILVETDPSVLGGQFQIMRRAEGTPLVDLLVRRPWAAPGHLTTMAGLLLRLHALPTDGFADLGPVAEVGTLDRLAKHAVPGPAVLDWLSDARLPAGPPVLCHLDFHPVNVMFAGAKPTAVLDWENAELGDPALDVADANLVLTAAPSVLPALLRPAESAFRRHLADRFLRRYRSSTDIPDDRLQYFTVMAATRRLLGAVLDAGDDPAEARGLPTPGYIAALASVIEQHTGIAPATLLRS